MKHPVKALLLILLLMNPRICFGQEPIILQLTGNQQHTIENGHYLTDGISLTGNASLTIINTTLTFRSSVSECELKGTSVLRVINSTLEMGEFGSIQVSETASIIFISSKLIGVNETTYQHGIIGSDYSKISLNNSQVGYVRLSGTATCTITDSYIGDFSSYSLIDPEIQGSTVERIKLVYENARVQINETLTGYYTRFNQSQLVKAGQNLYEINIINTTLLYPPNIVIIDGKLEAHDTILDAVQFAGDSAIETQNTRIYYLLLTEFCWAFIDDSNIDYFAAGRGEFNIHLTNTTHQLIDIFDSVGLNLKINGTETKLLNLDDSAQDRPQNVELQNMNIGELIINMRSPTPIQCNGVTIGNLTLESGWGNEAPRTITGTIDWSDNATVHQELKDGYTCIKRIYLIKATIDETPAANTQLTIHQNNKTKTITTDENGEAVLPVTYLRHLAVIQNPNPGGPYMINRDNLTSPVIITLYETNKTINILCDAPVIIKATSQSVSQGESSDWSLYTPAAVLVTLIVVAIYFVNSRRLEEANRQIQ
jgi:hypothetical protein